MLTFDHPTYMTYIFHIQGAMALAFHSASDFWTILAPSVA
jgi:hypothetical protein